MDNVDYVPGLEFLFDLSPDPLCLLSPGGYFIMVNNALKDTLCYSEAELLTVNVLDFIHQRDKEHASRQMAMLSGQNTVCSFENRYRCGNYQYKWLSWNVKRLPDQTVYASVRDITHHKDIQKKLDQANEDKAFRSLELNSERFEYVTEATSDIIWDWNLETNEVYYSDNIRKSFGHIPGINLGDMRFFAQHVHPDDRDRVVLYPEPIKYGTMKNWTEEYRFRKANGEYAFVLDKGIVIRDANGIGVRMIGAMQDVTELKKNQLHINRQNNQLMEIAQINAHEIRRPVATILGLIPLLNKQAIKDEDTLQILSHLETTTHQLDTVIKRIIDKTTD